MLAMQMNRKQLIAEEGAALKEKGKEKSATKLMGKSFIVLCQSTL